MAQKLSANFMAELFKLIYQDITITRIAACNLTYQLIPKEWPGYKFLLREAIEVFTSKEAIPSLGVVSQKYLENDAVQETIDQIKNAAKVDSEIIIDQLESYIKDVEFQLLSQKVHDLYEEGKKEEAIQVNAEESQRILSLSLRSDGGKFQQVFSDFYSRMKFRRENIESDRFSDKITLGIDRLDELSMGGAIEEDTVLWIMKSGQGKAQSMDSDIMTPTGIVKMKDIKIGTKILGSDGKEQEVIAIHPQGVIDCYKVTFNDGTEIECNDKHIWRVNNGKGWQNLELKDLSEKDFHNGEKWKVPNQPAVEFENQDIDIEPYTLGRWLGSNYLTSDHQIRKDEGNFGLRCCLKKYNLLEARSNTISIPKEYIFNDYKTRLRLLKGIFDTNGCVNEKGQIEFTLFSKQLTEDIAFIARSLGCFCYKISELKSSYKDKYQLTITPNKELNLYHSKKVLHCVDRIIKSIEYIGKKEMQCITVSNQDGLYLTNNFIITHNSTVLRHHAMSAVVEGNPVLHIQLEGGAKACLEKYDQYWIGQDFNDIRKGFLKEEDQKKIQRAYESMKNFGKDIDVYGFKKFGEASMMDIRNIILDYYKIHNYYPKVLIIDSLDLVSTGINKIIDTNPAYKKDKLQKCAQLLKDLCTEFSMVGFTATQASNIPIEIWDNEEKVIDRSYTEGDKTLVKPFSFVFTGNQTRKENKEKKMRIYVDKVRDYKGTQEIIPIITNYEKGRFYDKSETNRKFNNIPYQSSKKKQEDEKGQLSRI